MFGQNVEQLRALLPVIREKYGWVQELPSRWSRDLDWYLLRLGEFNAITLSSLNLKDLWAHVIKVSETGAHYFLPNIAISFKFRARMQPAQFLGCNGNRVSVQSR